ncbi:MAG: type II toxin-antitoxin system RelE/ParE family toxin [Deltaproteobacteria bacterium]|nr:type II toxin-antitoxin system RelE/ParE family toxin [Deltaproteobacteria bacterium]
MSFVFSLDAERDLRRYLYHVWAEDPQRSVREATRLQSALEAFSTAPLDGVVVAIQGFPRPVRRWFLRPFLVYYERRSDGLHVLRLQHHARRPIEGE